MPALVFCMSWHVEMAFPGTTQARKVLREAVGTGEPSGGKEQRERCVGLGPVPSVDRTRV